MAFAPRLEEVTPGNFETATGIRVRPEQEFAVSPVMQSLAEAYVLPHSRLRSSGGTPIPGVAWPRLIVDGDRTAGFLMAFLDIDWRADGGTVRRSGLWRLNIAADAQGQGYGRFAVDSVAAELRRRGTKELYVTWHEGPHGPSEFYLRLGFRRTGELSGGETVGVLDLA
ncbi:diamine N-acetyltransferase [Streptomyces canus]